MRIVLVVHGYPPAAGGGAEICAEAHARARCGLGDEVLVISREDSRKRPEYQVRSEERGGVRLTFINNTYRNTRSFEETYANDTIGAIAARVIDEFRPDVAHIHHLTGLSTAIVRVLAERAVPTFMTLHDYWLMCHRGQLLDLDGRACAGPGAEGCGRCVDHVAGAPAIGLAIAPAIRAIERALPAAAGSRLRRGAVRLAAVAADRNACHRQEARRLDHMREICRHVTRFIAPSNAVRERFITFGIDPARITVCRNGVDMPEAADARLKPSRYQPPPSRYQSPPSRDGLPLRLGFVGRLMSSKGPHVLLEAAAALPNGSATVDVFGEHAAYHGDDSYRARLAPMLTRENVRWHGAFARQAIADVYAGIDVLVVPSLWPETSSLVIHEACAAGVPVVASRIGAIPEAVRDGENGLLFDPGDAAGLSRALLRLIRDPRLLTSLRDGIGDVRAAADQAGELGMLYQDALASRRRATRRIAAVVLNYRTPDDTRLAVKSLLASRRPLDQLIVVDNDDRQTARDALRDVLPRVTILHTGRNLGYSGGMNAGIREALACGADEVLLTNSDVIVTPDCIERLERTLELEPDAGIAGPAVLARSDPARISSLGMSYRPATGRMRHAGFGDEIRRASRATAERVDGVSGCLMLVRREVFDRIGMLEDEYFFSFEDLDFCLKARAAGFATVLARSAVVHHEGSKSMGPDTPRRLFFAARNHLLLARRMEPSPGAFELFCRSSSILALNIAHAMRSSGGSLPVRLGAVARGVRDYALGRFGADA